MGFPQTVMLSKAWLRCPLLALAAISLLGACKTAEQRQAERDAERVDQICSLPREQREAELKRIREERGLVIYCGRTSD